MLKPRPAVLQMKEYHPPLGGRVGMRLDFNENTAGCSPRVRQALAELTPDDLARYPEREPAEHCLARFLHLPPEQVLLTNGVDEAIHLLCQAYIDPDDEVLIPVPTFSMYEIYAGAAGAKTVTVQSDPSLAFPAEQVLRAITPRTRLIAVANPNNPTGAAASEDALLRIAAAAPQAALLVDEAYFDFYGRTLMAKVGQMENLFVARTFSKAYGMAGLRAGVLAGSRAQMNLVRRVASPYNVNAAALACLPVAVSDEAYIADYVAQVRRGRDRMQQELAALGLRTWPSEANFVLFYVGDQRTELVAGMRRRGILLRDRNSDPGCAGCVRITIGTDAQTDAAIQALRAVILEMGGNGKNKAGA